jgi:putative DNA primase/helicase
VSKITDKKSLLKVQPGNIPDDLKAVAQWVVWRLEPKRGKPGEFTKVPYTPRSKPERCAKAASTRRDDWRTFEQALGVLENDGIGPDGRPFYPDGVGFVLSEQDDFVGVDIDNCRNAETGELTALVQTIIQNLDSYTEISPSGKGVRVILRGHLPPGGRKNTAEDVEMYESGRYLTITGHSLEVMP